MDLKLLKLSLKKELLWFVRTKKAWLIQCYMFVIPLVYRLDSNSFSQIEELKMHIILIGVIGVVGQYLLDSIYKDISRKVNNFYFNLNISIVYNMFSKMIVTLFLAFIGISYSLILLNQLITISELFLIVCVFINTFFISYFFINYFYNPDSIFLSCYLTIGLIMGMFYIIYILKIILLQILFQLIIMPFSVLLFMNLYKLKKIRLKTL